MISLFSYDKLERLQFCSMHFSQENGKINTSFSVKKMECFQKLILLEEKIN
jgi:hypothetical protein